jgi:hypothetical protein
MDFRRIGAWVVSNALARPCPGRGKRDDLRCGAYPLPNDPRTLQPITTLLIVVLTFFSTQSVPVLAEEQGEALFSQAELDQMMAPVALYPDSLLSQVLMASTYPAQVEEAVDWSKKHRDTQGDAAVEAVQDQAWDPSVASLVAFPQVLDMMGNKPDWVKQMGDAFLADPEGVMNTIQGLRSKAKEAGNLETSEQQSVIVEKQTSQTIIKIEPADPQVIYVPAYNPTVVYGTWWWPAYRPYYYVPPPYYGFGSAVVAGIGFGIGVAITNAIWGGFNWHRHDININVNRYNNININKRLDVNKTNVSWKHNPANRKGVSYADRASREKFGQKLGGADKRQDFRGRDADRTKALESLQRKGIDPAAQRKQLSGSSGAKVRDQVGKVDQQRRADVTGKFGDRSSAGRSDQGGRVGDKRASGRVDSGRLSEGAGVKQRDGSRPKSGQRRDSAFTGVGNGASTRKSADRGARSTSRSFGSAGGGRSLHGGGGGLGGRR